MKHKSTRNKVLIRRTEYTAISSQIAASSMVTSMKRQVVEESNKLDCQVNGPCSGEFHEGTKALGSVWDGITDRKSRSTGSFRGLKDICIFFSNIPLESLQVSSSSISHKSGFLMLYKFSLLRHQSEHPASHSLKE
ncbi:hypothetical protein MUK42_35999 [Musa troglodytarum]|uniref:Uncharacterized protein n=1 Tax=Musa troglodytarum TaxID=320322 RepID=A0A9E7JB98_9LILI|nr:hypothetical protein MUK42_35999 [Musa troglodytarum]